jgi:hypothetical protein
MKGQTQKEARYIKSALKMKRKIKGEIHTGATVISAAEMVITVVLGVSGT